MQQFLWKPWRHALVLPLVLSVFFVSIPAAAAAVGITLGSRATLTARVLVTVPVTVTCGPFDQFFGAMSNSVTVEQAAGNGIATGTGSIADLVCDGTPHTSQAGVLAAPTSKPFHGGSAVASASLVVNGIIGGQFVFDFGQAGPQVIAIRG
jgi:hypothetical protein